MESVRRVSLQLIALLALCSVGVCNAQAQLAAFGPDNECLTDGAGNAALNTDCSNTPVGNSPSSRYSTSEGDLYLLWKHGVETPAGCLPNSTHYDSSLGNLYVCGHWWDTADITIISLQWRSTQQPPETILPFQSAGWTGIYESELKYLHMIWMSTIDPWGGDPSAAGGLPD